MFYVKNQEIKMKNIVIVCYSWASLAEVPEEVARNIKKYERKFKKWLNKKDSPYKVELQNGVIGLDYNEEAFIVFLNQLFEENKSRILINDININNIEYKHMPRIIF